MFGDLRAVEDLDLRVEPGTLYGFLGRNGAGKSTTIKMLTGILAPSSGSIALLGVSPNDEAEAAHVRRTIGVVPEDLALFELLTGREYLNFVGTIYLLDEARTEERVDELFEVLNVGATEKQLVLEYSHGMRKKLALAAALIGDPALLFLDEPFEGVDAVSARVMRDILVAIRRPGGNRLHHLPRARRHRTPVHTRRHHRSRALGVRGTVVVPGRTNARVGVHRTRRRCGRHAYGTELAA